MEEEIQRVIDEPVLVGNDHGRMVIASYAPVAEYGNPFPLPTRAVHALTMAFPDARSRVDWARLEQVARTPQSVPLGLTGDEPEPAVSLAAATPERYDYAPYGSDANNARIPQQREQISAPTSR